MALLRSSFIVGIWTLASRVLGFARDILIARYLGTQGVPEAFLVAFRFPNLFRRLVAEGAFTAAFVPLFSKHLEADGKEKAVRFAEESLALLSFSLLIFVILCEIFMPWLMYVIAPGFTDDPEIFDQTVLFTRITMPYLMFMALLALYGGVLNSLYRFAAVAAAPVLLNVILVATLVLAGDLFPTMGHALSWGVVLSGAVQFLVLVFAAHRVGIRLRLPRPRVTSDMKHMLALMVPGAIGAGVTQINLLVGTMIATLIPGAVSYLYYGERVYQFPLGVIGIAIGTALLPTLSRQLRADDPKIAKRTLNRAIEISMLITVPAAAAMIVIAEPIVKVMFERGEFGPQDTIATAAALAAFGAGLPAFVLIKVLSPGFFAREDTRTPVIFAAVGVVLNIVFSLILLKYLAHVGIAVATSISAWVNTILLAVALYRRGYLAADSQLYVRLPLILAAAVAMAAAVIPAAGWLTPWFAGTLFQKILAMGGLVAYGVIIYIAAALIIRAASLRELAAAFRKG